MKALEHELSVRFGTRVKAAMPLKELTSFRIGGPADLFINVEDETELMHAKSAAYRAGVPCFCLGAGTDVAESPTSDLQFHDHYGLQLLYAERLAANFRSAWVPTSGRTREVVELVFMQLKLAGLEKMMGSETKT